MIDIHSHIIPFVDDGSSSFEASLELIKESINQGVTDIICTPHLWKHKYETKKEEIIKNFNILKNKVNEEKLKINLYLGQEIFVRSIKELEMILDSDKFITLNESKYLLLEFPPLAYTEINDIIYTTIIKGFIPIVAHVERYIYLDNEGILDIKDTGGLIQINALSIVGLNSRKIKKRVLGLIKIGAVDFVASDIHENRINAINKSYKIITKKFNLETRNKLFVSNAKKIIGVE